MKRFKYLFENEPGLLEPNPPSYTRSPHGPKSKSKKVSEQYREEGRFKPTVPRMVKNKGVGPRPTVDSVKVKLKENFGKATPSAEEVAKKHGVSVDEIEKQLEMGMKVEKEHTTKDKTAREIALDHLSEKPNYYSKLKKYVEGVEPDSESIAARTYVEKPQKEPLKKMKTFKEDLRNWFKPDHPEGGWKRINSKGEAIGPCAREPGEPKPKCMSNEKRASLTKKERASAVRAKRKHDPNPERKGKPINVSNFGKGKLSEDMKQLDEKNVPTSPEKWARAKAQAKAKFDVYPSAYANGWAAKKYKEMGGGWKSVNEDAEQIEEGRASQRHPLEGHEYHKKTDAELRYIAKDAHEAAEAMKGHNTTAENKYRDQANDSATVRHWRQKNGTPDWYKKKYGHVKEETEVNEDLKSTVQKVGKLAKSPYDFAKKRLKNPDAELSSQEKQDWKKVHEEKEQIDELSTDLLGRYKKAAGAQASAANKAGDVKKGDKRFSAIMKATLKQFKNDAKPVKEATEKPPFDPPYKKASETQTDKSGAQHSPYSRVRHLARMAAQRNNEKTKKSVKEEFSPLQESRKAEIVREIVKKKKNENPKEGADKFQKEPVLGSEIVKT